MKNCPSCDSTRFKKIMGIQRCIACGYIHKDNQIMLKEFENKNDNNKEDVATEEKM